MHEPIYERIHLYNIYIQKIIVQNEFDVHTSCNSRSIRSEDIAELINHSHGVHNVYLHEVTKIRS